jgi:hypothetical protein
MNASNYFFSSNIFDTLKIELSSFDLRTRIIGLPLSGNLSSKSSIVATGKSAYLSSFFVLKS